jgi:N-methylhydantoinase A
MLLSDLQHDFVRTFVARLESLDWARLEGVVDAMVAEGGRLLAEERIPESRRRFELRLDCRYIKQYHEVSVPIARDLVARRDAEAIARAFHAEHNRLYGYSLEAERTPIELINVRVQAIGAVEKPRYRKEDWAGEDASCALKGRRSVYIPEANTFRTVPVYDGHKLGFGNRVVGPAMIEEVTTAVFVSDAYDCAVDACGSFAVYRRGRENLVKLRVAEEVA